MSTTLAPDIARLICGNIDDLRNSLQLGAGSDRSLLERSLAACTGREQKTKRTLIERALRKLDRAATARPAGAVCWDAPAPAARYEVVIPRPAGAVLPRRRWKGVRA